MSDDSISDSGQEYLPDLSDDYSDSCYSCLEDDSDTEILQDIEPIVDEGWQFITDPFCDKRPDPPPDFTEGDNGISVCAPDFTCPRDAFCFFFCDDDIDRLCEWMNARAEEYFRSTGKCTMFFENFFHFFYTNM